MNTVKVEATQGTAFDLILQRSEDLSDVTAEGAIVAGNLLDPTISPMVASGDTLNTLTSSPAAGLTIDTAAKTIAVHLDATATVTWITRYVSLQVFITPTAATRKEAARVLVEVTPDIT